MRGVGLSHGNYVHPHTEGFNLVYLKEVLGYRQLLQPVFCLQLVWAFCKYAKESKET